MLSVLICSLQTDSLDKSIKWAVNKTRNTRKPYDDNEEDLASNKVYRYAEIDKEQCMLSANTYVISTNWEKYKMCSEFSSICFKFMSWTDPLKL